MTKNGFTIFFAMLVGGLALSIGAAIYDLTVRELDLSSTATQSQFAIYAADTGTECALYWDFQCPGGTCPAAREFSAFATSSASAALTGAVTCNGQNVSTYGTPPAAYGPPTAGWTVWNEVKTASAATTTFTLAFPPEPYCVQVEVAKYGNPTRTTITARGYNTCVASSPMRLERVLQVTY